MSRLDQFRAYKYVGDLPRSNWLSGARPKRII